MKQYIFYFSDMQVLTVQFFLFRVNCKYKSGIDLAKYYLANSKYEQELFLCL